MAVVALLLVFPVWGGFAPAEPAAKAPDISEVIEKLPALCKSMPVPAELVRAKTPYLEVCALIATAAVAGDAWSAAVNTTLMDLPSAWIVRVSETGVLGKVAAP